MLPIPIINTIIVCLSAVVKALLSKKKEKPPTLGPLEIEAERLRVEQLVLQEVVRCEKCAFEYIYRVRPWVYSPVAAVRIAGKRIFPMPCPMCGWLQRDMVRCARKLRRHRLQLSSIALFLTAIILYEAFVVVGGIAAEFEKGGGDAGLWTSAAAVCGALPLIATAVAVVLLVLPVVLLVLRLLLPRFDNPNAGVRWHRIALGKRWAVSKKDYDSGLIVLPTE